MSCSQVNCFTQISVSLGTMSIRPDSPKKRSSGYQITSDTGCMCLPGPVQHNVNDTEMYFSSSSQASFLPSRQGQLLLLGKAISLWPSVLNPYSSISMCIFEKCPPESWDQIRILEGDMLLVSTQGAYTSVQLDHC